MSAVAEDYSKCSKTTENGKSGSAWRGQIWFIGKGIPETDLKESGLKKQTIH